MEAEKCSNEDSLTAITLKKRNYFIPNMSVFKPNFWPPCQINYFSNLSIIVFPQDWKIQFSHWLLNGFLLTRSEIQSSPRPTKHCMICQHVQEPLYLLYSLSGTFLCLFLLSPRYTMQLSPSSLETSYWIAMCKRVSVHKYTHILPFLIAGWFFLCNRDS